MKNGLALTQERVDPLLASGDERRFEVPLRADLEENHLLSGYAHRVFDVFRLKFVSGIAWIDEHRDPRGTGQQLFQELQPLRQQIRSVQIHAGGIAARPVKAGHETIADWIRANNEEDRNGRGRLFRRPGRHCAPGRHDQGHPTVYQVGRQLRQPRKLTLRPTVLDPDVPAFDIAASA